MTPLQIAAKQVIDRWDSPLWKDQLHTGVYIAELRKALEAEQAQAVECTSDEWLANCPQSVRDLANKIKQAQAVEPVAWMSTDCIGERTLLFTKPAWEPIPDKVEPLYLHPTPPPTIKESLKVHASAEDYMRYKYGAYRGHFAWRELAEAYSQGRYDEEMAQGPSKAEWAAMEAQQVAVPVPMTENEMFKLWRDGGAAGGAAEFEDTVRAVEAHHKIGAKP